MDVAGVHFERAGENVVDQPDDAGFAGQLAEFGLVGGFGGFRDVVAAVVLTDLGDLAFEEGAAEQLEFGFNAERVAQGVRFAGESVRVGRVAEDGAVGQRVGGENGVGGKKVGGDLRARSGSGEVGFVGFGQIQHGAVEGCKFDLGDPAGLGQR